MAVSGSTDFKSTAVEIITDARRLIGIHAEEEALAAHELETGLRVLTKMLKSWEADGIGSWVLTEGTLFLSEASASYTFGAGGAFSTVPFEITQMRISKDDGNEIEMTRLSREEYFGLPNKTSTGHPVQFFYDRQRDNGKLYVWPAPDDDYDLAFTYRRRIMDLDDGTNNFDLPPEWEDAITYNLAERLMPMYGRSGTPEASQVVIRAGALYQTVKDFDIGESQGSIMMEPDPYYRFGR